jgi:esterase/lipase superfamily enzyme
VGRGSRSPASVEPRETLVDKRLRFVRVFYGTNRNRTDACAGATTTRWDAPGACRPNQFYGGLPASAPGPLDTPAGTGLDVGTVTVTFPPSHASGKIERPPAVFTIEMRGEDPDRDVLIEELHAFGGDYEGWVREVRATGRDQAFIYVHGFETTFDEAARRAAQVAYDLDFDLAEDFRGIPMLYSWPSRGELLAYMADYDASMEATDAFNRFLDLVKLTAGVRRVHVIAHSMGNRVVAEALRERAAPPEPILDQLILAAPDIWASRFKTHFLRTLPRLASRVTLYVSDQDRALRESSRIRRDEPRAGERAGGLLEAGAGVEGFEAIDASSLDNDFLGHSYYASNRSMLSDIYCLLKGTPAAGRPLLAAAGVAWRFRPLAELMRLDGGACAPPSLPSRSVTARRTWPYWAGGLLAAILVAMFIVRWVRHN